MKFIRRVAGYGPWAVAVALGLDISYPVQAAPPVVRPPVPITAVAATAATDDIEAATNVQVAWLADPGLFQCTLSARITEKGMELSGYVASEPAHQKAVAIARALCAGPVVDHVKIHFGVPIQMSHGAAPAELAQLASAALAEAMGDKVLSLRVTCPSAGRVEITGSVPTLEDKLRVSKCMKTLTGCTHIINRTTAPGSAAGDAIVANIPLMMTKSTKTGPVDGKLASDPIMPAPMVVKQPLPMPVRPVGTTMAAPRAVTNIPIKNTSEIKADNKMVVVPPTPAKTGYASAYDAKPADVALANKAPEPSWPMPKPVMPVAAAEEKKAVEAKPVEVMNAPSAIMLPEIRSAKVMEPLRPSVDKPQMLHLMPEAPKTPEIMPPIESKAMEATVEATKSEKVVKALPDVAEPPKPIIVPPIMPPVVPAMVQSTVPAVMPSVKETVKVQSPYGGVTKPVSPPNAVPVVVELPKPAELPKHIEMPNPVVEMPLITAGKPNGPDLIQPEPVKVVEKPAEEIKTIEAPKAAPPIVAEIKPVEATNMAPPVIAAIEAPKPVMSKVERFVAPTLTPEPVKPVTYSQGSTTSKSSKEPVSLTLDSETVRRAVEDVCRGAGSDLKVTTCPNRQLIIGLKVASQGEWDRLYTKVKALPEINGYSVMYNAQVDGPAIKPVAATAETAAKSSSAPMMGVLRSNASNSTPSADAAKAAIEKLCQGKGDDISVRTPGGKQVAVSLKIASAADWEMLYAQIKALPEIAGCSVIYNVSVK